MQESAGDFVPNPVIGNGKGNGSSRAFELPGHTSREPSEAEDPVALGAVEVAVGQQKQQKQQNPALLLSETLLQQLGEAVRAGDVPSHQR